MRCSCGYVRRDNGRRARCCPRLHLNDSKKPLGARVDRHAVLGDGHIGLAPFARLIHDERFATLPGFLETPPLPSGEESYALGLSRLRGLSRS